MRVNVGCGQNPTQGWRSFDNSFSVQMAKIPLLAEVLLAVKMLNKAQYDFIKFARENRIEYGNVVKGLPIDSGKVEVLYSSHMIEHLDQREALLFLREVKRVLRPGGVLRLTVPDIRKQVQKYLENGDADEFVAQTLLAQPRAGSFAKRLQLLFVGQRNHKWMYDGKSLSQLLQENGFEKISVISPGETRISRFEPLDLTERVEESFYIEAEIK